MWIRFKFRSAVSFDVVDIGDRPAISVGELKSKIIAHKNLKSYHDFDLLFSDHLSGQEYNDENYQIPSNSSVIIKRVPAVSVPSALPFDSIENLGMKKSDIVQEKGGEMDGFDLCPVPENIFPYSDLESRRKNICDTEKANIVGSRLGSQKLQANDLVEVIPKGSDHNGTKGKLPPGKLEPKDQEHVKLGKRAIDPHDLAEKNASLPSELRCPICNKYFKEAVMTPCCHQSFCGRCISGVLAEKSKCPKCSSDKFKAEHLLPNISLRLALEQFLESQIESSISETALRRYAPDGESGIEAKDLSGAVQKRQKNLLYPSATEKVSNRLLGGSFHGESLMKRNVRHALSPSQTRYHPGLANFQGDNHPLNLPQNHAQENGDDGKVPATARYRKADRTCYMCDAPDHFIRDCPFANGPHPMPQTGNSMYAVGARPTFVTPYWKDTAFGPMRPFSTIYANHGMMPYNASTFPVSPLGVSPYMASMYSHVPTYNSIPMMAGMAPLTGNRSENPSRHEGLLETQSSDIRGNHSNEYMMRRQPSDDDDADIQTDRHNLPNSSQEYLYHAERVKSESYSGEKHTQKSRGNDRPAEYFDRNVHSLHDRHVKNPTGTRDRKAYHAERSNSRVENMSKSSDRYVDERHNHHHHKITRNHCERKGHFGSDSNWNQRKGQKDKRRVYSDEKGFSKQHGSQFGSSEERSFSRDRKKWQRDGDQSRRSKHSRDGSKYIRNELFCRSKMVRWNEDCKEDNYHPKRKRVY